MTGNIPDIQHAWVNVSRGAPSEALVFREDWPVPKKTCPWRSPNPNPGRRPQPGVSLF